MARKSPSNAGRRRARNPIVKAVKEHPLGALAVAGGVVATAALLTKAANTTAKVVTIKAAANAAKEVTNAVKKPAASKRRSTKRA